MYILAPKEGGGGVLSSLLSSETHATCKEDISLKTNCRIRLTETNPCCIPLFCGIDFWVVFIPFVEPHAVFILKLLFRRVDTSPELLFQFTFALVKAE